MPRHRKDIFDWVRILGELLITAGVVLLLFVTWQVFVNDPLVSQAQQNQANQYNSPNSAKISQNQFEDMSSKLPQGKVFAKIYIPRFAKNYVRLIGQGTFQKITLNNIGVGHYVTSQWPGEVGNFAVAAHRTSHGAPFFKIDTLTTNDEVFIETNKVWYTYKYLQTKIVTPDNLGVIDKVPVGLTGAVSGGKYMTMTSCNPKWSNTQRIVVWLELVDAQETSLGMPPELVKLQAQ